MSRMAFAEQAEILPVVLTGQDSTAAMWGSFKKNAGDTKNAIDAIKKSMEGVGSGNAVSGIQNLSGMLKYLANPYVAVAAAIAAVGIEGVSTVQRLAAVGDAAAQIGVKATAIAGLGDELEKAGGKSDYAISSLKTLKSQLETNQRDGGYLDKLFTLNGSSIDDSAGKLRNVKDIYSDVARFIQNAANETERLEIATNAFGSEAAPSMVKAIMAGADNIDRFARTDLGPLIRDSQELAGIWKSMTSGDTADWINNLQNKWHDGVNSWAKTFALIAGSKRALETAYLDDNSNASRAMGQSDVSDFYNAVRGKAGATITPNNRKDEEVSRTRNEFDRAVNSIGKHVAIMQADADAVGKTAGEHEKLRVQAQLLDAAQRAGIPVIGKTKDEFDALAEKAKKAADALAFAKLQNDLMFERDQMGRTALEQSVSGRLRGAGVDPNSAQGEFLAQQIRINEVIATTEDISKDALKGLRSDLKAGVSEGQAFANMLDKITTKLEDKVLDNAINVLVGRGVSGLASSFGFGGSAGTLTGTDAALNKQLFPGYGTGHSGATIGRNVTGYKHIHPAYFDGAPRYHTGGRLGPREVPFIGLEGEDVGFPEQMKAKYGGGKSAPKVSVTVINNVGADVSVGQPKSDGAGGINLEVIVDRATAANIAKPGSDSSRALDQRGALAKR
jgi:hypothetical protein